MADQAKTPPRRKRWVLCMGPYCNEGGRAEPLYERLRQELGDPGPAFMSRAPVTWETANCVSLCGCGPNLILYPDEAVFNQLTLEKLEQIIVEHLKKGETNVRPDAPAH